ncbi:MAG: hypothetical protein IKO25_08435 [Clostridia bacterium]|nr:hypothetical protein [Clostridia bacterium]
MTEHQKESLFRSKTLKRISAPDHLTDYLRVANPSIWVTVAAVVLLLAGIFSWLFFGNLETTVEARVIADRQTARVMPAGPNIYEIGMPLRVEGEETAIITTETDEYGRICGIAELSLPDGVYTGTVITRTVHPIQFLLTGR